MQPLTDAAEGREATTVSAEPARPPVPWSWWDGLVVFALSLVGTLLVSGLVVTTLGPDSATAVGLLLSGPGLGLVAVAWVARRAGRPGLNTLAGWRRPGAADIAMGAVHGFVAFLGTVALSFVASSLDLQLPEVQEDLAAAARSPLLPLVVLAAVVLAPIVEEMVFRGMIFRAFADRLPLAGAVLLAGIAFGLVHVEPLAIAVTTCFGIYACLVYARRGTLVATISMHAVFNACGVLGLVLAV